MWVLLASLPNTTNSIFAQLNVFFFIVFYVYVTMCAIFFLCVINTRALECVCFSSYPISQISLVSFLIPVIPALFARHHLQSHSEDFTYVCVCRTSVCEGLSAGHTGVIDVDAPPWAITARDLETLFVRFICHL